jgi:leader peptidase (prepilin peptidase)/N-methyltransferase
VEPDALDIRRIDVGGDIEVWVKAPPRAAGTEQPEPAAEPVTETSPTAEPAPEPAAAGRRWEVRPVAIGLGTVLAALALLRLGVTPEGVLGAGLLAVLAVLAVIDLDVRLLPNRIVGPAVVAVLAFQIAFMPEHVVEGVLAGLAAAAFLWVPSLVRPGAMGMGDVKLAGLIGAALGAPVVLVLVAGSLAAWPVAVAMVIRGRSVRGATIPFGPFLAFGAAVVVLA